MQIDATQSNLVECELFLPSPLFVEIIIGILVI